MQNPLWKNKECTKLINVIIENKQSHKSGANITLYNAAMKGFTFLSQIFI